MSGPVIALLFCLPLVLLHGCHYEHCKTDKKYAEAAGICGKIYRTERAKERFEKGSHFTVFAIMAVALFPLVMVILFRLLRLLLSAFVFLFGRVARKER